jgi:hypothetical protein
VRRGRKRVGPAAVAALVVLVLLAGALVLLSNPRHRAFYFGGGTATAPADEEPPRPSLPRAPFRLPAPPSFVGPAAAPTVSPVAAVHPGRHVPQPDAEGRIRVPVADRPPRRLPAEGVPMGWQLKEFAGRAAIELVRGDRGLAVRLRSAQASFALYRDVIVDFRESPFLAWRWRVARLPAAGDVRERSTDDQAAQVYVIFPRWPAPLANSEVLGYLWDSRAPVGTRLTSSKAPNVRLIVVESGASRLDTWQRQERNVAEDYATLFGRQPPRAGQLALMIDANDTRGDAEAFFADIVFSRAPSERMEKPTSMLR